ncbi:MULTISPECIES: hypothetical protein [Bradyrhizobium]|uniref:hypothetical protein n=1 Tax=Bradyrhizobium TaxID=374 RepID=UPI0008EEF4AB|nr:MULTISPECIES: hypothetical protein [Bradyrhizobium]QOG16591.1 hypothetical protein FOM02_03855 [Bradyrhizobium sp. SEMIA]UFW49197.1 hypothetical protein BaraCB756_44460 [Bradyrhizobium arachidis]SFU39166.1 hypothetical protein SAMN05192541_101682 [Bradyrhizobium arachidis]
MSRRLLLLWIVLSLLWGCVAGSMAILVWKGDAHARAYERASAAVWAKYDSDCASFKTKAPLCDFPPAKPPVSAIPNFAYPAVVLGPPLVLFFFGWVWLGVTSGLRR